MATVVQAPAPDNITWRVVINRSGTHYLYMMRMYSQLPSSVVKDRILALYLQGQPWWSRWFCKPVMGLVTIVRAIDSESQPSNGEEVIVTSTCLSAFDLATNHAFTLSSWASPGEIGPARAILLQPKLSQTGLCLLTLSVLLAVVAPGVLLGMTLGQAELGITLSAAIAGTFALAGSLCRQRLYD